MALVLNPVHSAEELLKTVCDELGLKYGDSASSPAVLADTFHRHVLAAHSSRRRVGLVVDDAHNLGVDATEKEMQNRYSTGVVTASGDWKRRENLRSHGRAIQACETSAEELQCSGKCFLGVH